MKVLIEEYTEKPRTGFYMPVIPWKWTIYDGAKILTYGYTHTEEDAKRAANQAIKRI